MLAFLRAFQGAPYEAADELAIARFKVGAEELLASLAAQMP